MRSIAQWRGKHFLWGSLLSLKFAKNFRYFLKARINAHDELASALKSAYNRIKQSVAISESQEDPAILNTEEITVCVAPLHCYRKAYVFPDDETPRPHPAPCAY